MDKHEFASRVLEMETDLYRISKTILRNDFDCADATQNALLLAYKKLDSLKKEEFFKTWLTRILINECYQLLRKRDKHVFYEDDMQSMVCQTCNSFEQSEVQPEQIIEKNWLMEVLYGMEDTYRLPIVLYYVEGFKIGEIEKILGIGRSAVYARLSRGRKILKERLKEE